MIEKEFDRIRWRCRRGLLELDIVLARFLDAHYAGLSGDDRQILAVLLEYPDVDLWRLVSGKDEPEDERLRTVLGLLRAS